MKNFLPLVSEISVTQLQTQLGFKKRGKRAVFALVFTKFCERHSCKKALTAAQKIGAHF